MELRYFKEAIKKLNAPTVFEADGKQETFDSLYNFAFKRQADSLLIYDRNEQFNINTDEETRCIVYAAAKEFGFEYKTPKSTEERIFGLLEDALKKDLGHRVVIEWQDTVCLIAYLG